MERATETLILGLLDRHNILTLATVREDGWPQATTVGYVNEGLTLYVGCGSDSQKLANILCCPKVSLTVDDDEPDWSRIQGLSMAATAEVVSDPTELARAGELFMGKFPQLKDMPEPEPGTFTILKLTPKVISVLDYTKGFGHTDLVTL
jgi:nitroimidazol reductase NimA-like FMN-containing flavoprotein (pyridoxamine 5'-phosphate oxidase superfamily)